MELTTSGLRLKSKTSELYASRLATAVPKLPEPNTPTGLKGEAICIVCFGIFVFWCFGVLVFSCFGVFVFSCFGVLVF
jgi:hypothetical protein